jgi:hypothetical protein
MDLLRLFQIEVVPRQKSKRCYDKMIRKILSTLRSIYKRYPELYSLAELSIFLGIYFVNMWVTRFWFWGIYALNIHVPDTIDSIFLCLWRISPNVVVPSVIVGLLLFVLSIFVRKDSLKDLGIRLDNIKPSGKECLIAALIGVNVVIAIFFIHHEDFTPHSFQDYLVRILEYIWWGTVQQFVLLSVIFVRMEQILRNRNSTIFVVSLIFALLHTPHIAFMVLTFVVGLVCCILFLRHRNILTLGVTHGVTAVMAFSLLVPGVIDNWHKGKIADFNVDGSPDILWRHFNGINVIWYMNENGRTVESVGRAPYREKNWKVRKVADCDEDGVPDILWRNTNGSYAMWYMDEDGTANKGDSVAPP